MGRAQQTEWLLPSATGGLWVGGLLGSLDALGTAWSLGDVLWEQPGALAFLGRVALVPLAGAVLLGVLTSGVLRAVWGAISTRTVAEKRPRMLAWVLACGAGPLTGWLVTQALAGPRMQRLPHRALWLVLGWVLLSAGVGGLVWLGARVYLRLQRREPGTGWLWGGLGMGLLLVLVGLMGADRLVLPRLYGWFHLALRGGALLTGLGLAELWTMRPKQSASSGGSRLVAGVVALVALGSSGWALHRLFRATVLRAYVLEHGTISASLLDGYGRLVKRPARLPSVPLQTPGVASPVFQGPRLAGRDVVLITIDALRHDAVQREIMPTVHAFGQRGITFSRAYTQVPHTSFAIATLLTGRPVYALLGLGHDAASHETLPTVLRRFRYKTAAFYPPAVFYIERERLRALEDSAYGVEYLKYEYLPADRRTDQVLAFFEAEKPEKAFVWVHYLDPHEPYEVHAGDVPASASDRARYEGELRYVDAQVARLLRYLADKRPGALVLIAADHGEEFGEHGGRYHGTTLYEEQIHVPLLIGEAGDAPRLTGQRLDFAVGLLDVAPTILGLLDIERSAKMRGRDLSGWLLVPGSASPTQSVFAEIGRTKMVVRGDEKLICELSTDTCRLFDLASDPGEKRPILGADSPLLKQELVQKLAEAQGVEGSQGGAGAPSHGLSRSLVARAVQGDRSTLPLLLTISESATETVETRQQARTLLARLVVSIPPEAALAGLGPAEWARARAQLVQVWQTRPATTGATVLPTHVQAAGLALLRLGDGDEGRLAFAAGLIAQETTEDRERVTAALAVGGLSACQRAAAARGTANPDCLPLWLATLPAALRGQDTERARSLLGLIEASHDRRALPVLIAALEPVLSRGDVVTALGRLGEREAVEAVAERLRLDPYTHVRVAAARALGQLGGLQSQRALQAAQAREQEELVLQAIRQELTRLRKP